MADFLAALSFSLVPFLTTLLFAAALPPVGASLCLRNEVMLGLALPSAGSAVLAAAVLCGVPARATGLLFALTVAALFAVTRILPLGPSGTRLPLRKREMVLAVMLVAGNALTLLFMAFSTESQAHLRHLLNGELLAVSKAEFAAATVLTLVAAFTAFRFRGAWFAFSLDEESLLISSTRYAAIRTGYRLLSALLLTAALMLIGPLLCTALLIVPALCAEKGSGNLATYFVKTIVLGVLGTLAGLALSLALDLPPSYVATVTLLLLAGVVRVIMR